MSRSASRSQSRNGSSASAQPHSVAREASGEPDVFLSVPDLHVGEIELDVENLEAHLALQARLANLLELRAGAHVTIEKVDLHIKDVAARAMLKVRLENVYAILDRALTTIDRNPQILEGLIETADNALGREGALGGAIEGLGRAAGASRDSGRLARLRSGLRGLHRTGRSTHVVTKVATAAGVIGGAALAAHSNGGIEKTVKELTS